MDKNILKVSFDDAENGKTRFIQKAHADISRIRQLLEHSDVHHAQYYLNPCLDYQAKKQRILYDQEMDESEAEDDDDETPGDESQADTLMVERQQEYAGARAIALMCEQMSQCLIWLDAFKRGGDLPPLSVEHIVGQEEYQTVLEDALIPEVVNQALGISTNLYNLIKARSDGIAHRTMGAKVVALFKPSGVR